LSRPGGQHGTSGPETCRAQGSDGKVDLRGPGRCTRQVRWEEMVPLQGARASCSRSGPATIPADRCLGIKWSDRAGPWVVDCLGLVVNPSLCPAITNRPQWLSLTKSMLLPTPRTRPHAAAFQGRPCHQASCNPRRPGARQRAGASAAHAPRPGSAHAWWCTARRRRRHGAAARSASTGSQRRWRPAWWTATTSAARRSAAHDTASGTDGTRTAAAWTARGGHFTPTW
jgi:hypothetical protein